MKIKEYKWRLIAVLLLAGACAAGLIAFVRPPPVEAIERCDWRGFTCFGINWETATVAEVAEVDINARTAEGWSPLHWAAGKSQKPAFIAALLDSGMDVNITDGFDRTPLHWAAVTGQDAAMIEALINAGADISARTKDTRTVLHWAGIMNPNPGMIETLVSLGADIHWQDGLGRTPLHAAAMDGKEPTIIEALLTAGANANAKDSEGKTAFDYATENENIVGTEVYRLLKEALTN